MMYLQTGSYNLDVAKVFGVEASVLLTCLDKEFDYQRRAHSISEDSSISLSRAEIYARTGLLDEVQIETEFGLQECGVLIVKPLKNIPNKNYYFFDNSKLVAIMSSEDPAAVLGAEKARQFTKQPRVEPISKRKNRIIQLKKKINVSDPVIQQYMCDWIDAVYNNPKGFLSPTAISIAQDELLNYCKDSQEKQIAILKIAIKGGLRDLTWAIQQYEESNANKEGSRNFMEYNDSNIATSDNVSTEETF